MLDCKICKICTSFYRKSEPESLTDALQSQVAFYKGEYENLKLETKSLIEENATMTQQLDELLKTKCHQETAMLASESEKEIINGLRRELISSQKEKESFAALWKSSQNAVLSLENELKTYQNHSKVTMYDDLDEIKREYSSVVKSLNSKLSTALDDLKVKEERIINLLSEKDITQKILNEKEKSVNQLNVQQSEAQAKIDRLEKEIANLKNEISICRRNSESLSNNVNEYAKKELESRYKVTEALKLVEAAIAERDNALEREKIAIGEKTRFSNQITEVLNESSLRVQKEIDVAKQLYNDKLNDMLIHIQRLELELGEKDLALERSIRECSTLEEKMQTFKNCSCNSDEKINKILMLEQKLEATFQELILSERRNIQIVSEKENLQMDFDQLTNGFQRDKRKREWEEKLHSNEINSLRIKVNNLKDTLDGAHKTIQRLHADVICKEEQEEKLVNDKLQTTKEFEKHFETQRKLNIKWKENMKEIVSKLENTVEELFSENNLLKEENERLSALCKT